MAKMDYTDWNKSMKILGQKIFLLLLFMPIYGALFAQHTYVPQGSLSEHILDRLEIKSGELPTEYFHSAGKSFRRMAIANYVDSFKVNRIGLSKQDYFNMSYLINDNFEWSNSEQSKTRKPFLKQFYTRKAALYSVQIPDFNLVVNPVLYYQLSTNKWNGENALINNRGIEIRGNVGSRIGFYTQVSDEILKPNSWVGEYYTRDGTLMYANFVKGYGTYYSYFLSSGYVTGSLNKYMDLQFGHYRNFIGDGYRTFILGNMHPEYLSLRLNTRIWKMNYTNIWAELRDPNPGAYKVQPRHYMATHHLSLNLTKNFNLGIFETILFHRDSGYVNTGFDANYLNPIIFYKSIENGLNSTDKAIIGMNFKYNFLKHFSWYGQFVISEFVLKEIMAGDGWMHNKFSVQTGIKYIDVAGIRNLDLQGEFNMARPFQYTSYSAAQSFSNMRQFMAHPLGANFYEGVGIVRYQPVNRLYLCGKIIYALYGNDTNGSNFGKDIRYSYNTHSSGMYGNYIGQGVETRLLMTDLTGSYMPFHNLFVDAKIGYRRTLSEMDLFKSEAFYFTLGIRLNIVQRNYDF
jgi:hypothetical protein